MRHTLYYMNNGKKVIVELSDYHLRVKEYKEEISCKFSIPVKFIVLSFEGFHLEDDKYLSQYNLKGKCEIIIKIMVIVRRISYEETERCQGGRKEEYCQGGRKEDYCQGTSCEEYCQGEYKDDQYLMDVTDKIRDLKLKLSSTVSLENVRLECGGLCGDDYYLKEYLKRNEIFYKVSMLIFKVINKVGKIKEIEGFENERINSLTKMFPKYSNYIMINNDIVSSKCLLYKCKGQKLFIGFIINVNQSNNLLRKLCVNVNTRISRLKELISKNSSISVHLISLRHKERDLLDYETVGFYNIREFDTLIMEELVEVTVFYKGENITSTINSTETVLVIKKKVSLKYKVTMNKIRFEINDKEVNDNVEVKSLKKGVITIKVGDQEVTVTIINNLKSSKETSFNIIVPVNISVELLMNEISKKLGRSLCDVDLYFLNQVVNEGTIDSYRIKDKDSLTLKQRKYSAAMDNMMIVKVRTDLNEGIHQYTVNGLDHLRTLKCILRDQYNTNVDRIKLFLKESELKDDDIISRLDFEDELTLTLLIEPENNVPEEQVKIRLKNCFHDIGGVTYKDISVKITETVESLSTKCEELFKLFKEKFILSYAGEVLKKEVMLRSYNIKDHDEIKISRSLLVNYLVGFETSFMKVHRYTFMTGDTVKDLHQKIFKKINIEPRFIHLIFNGMNLESYMILEDQGVENESYLFMIATLSGGF